ncbi:MAG: hypothetical protein ACOY16_10020 [Chloroflexota bacterium]
MACINPDGTLAPSALAILRAVVQARSAAEIAQLAALPLFRVRSSIRELVDAGLLKEEEGLYQITEAGQARVGS